MTVLDPMHRLRTALESPMRPAPHRLTLVSAKDGSCMHENTHKKKPTPTPSPTAPYCGVNPNPGTHLRPVATRETSLDSLDRQVRALHPHRRVGAF